MDHWNIIKEQAIKFKAQNTEWTSFVQKKKYKILEVSDPYIYIKKEGKGNDVSLSSKNIQTAFEKLESKGKVRNGKLLGSVARESALLFLHPLLTYDVKKKQINFNNSEGQDIFTHEAEDDNDEKVLRLIRKRRNQSKFRSNLIKLYNGKCCLSKCDVTTLLEAAHISFHAKTGINDSTNGLLLRADLHILFDENLLAINPRSLIAIIHPKLKNSEYWIYNGIKISDRNDNMKPNIKFLKERWNSCKWKKK